MRSKAATIWLGMLAEYPNSLFAVLIGRDEKLCSHILLHELVKRLMNV